MQRIRVVIADDQEIFRDGLKLVIECNAQLMLAGEATHGKELLHIVAHERPDVVLTDIKMPVMDGITATKEIIQLFPETGVIALSMFGEEDLISDMLNAGALGYMIKNADKAEIYQAIENAYKFQPFYCRTISHQLAKVFAKERQPIKEICFTDKEKEIIMGMCNEQSNQEIAEQLYLGRRTVESYRARIMEKMEVKTTVGVVKYAIRKGIYKLDN